MLRDMPLFVNPYLEIPGCLRSVVPDIKKKDDLFITRFFLFSCLLSVSGLLIQLRLHPFTNN